MNILTWDTASLPPPDQNILPLGEISVSHMDHTHDGFNKSCMCAQIISKQNSSFCNQQSKYHVKCDIYSMNRPNYDLASQCKILPAFYREFFMFSSTCIHRNTMLHCIAVCRYPRKWKTHRCS